MTRNCIDSVNDTETVWDEDSLLSPCLWTLEKTHQVTEESLNCTKFTNQKEKPHNVQALDHELQLSPRSQLHVISQITLQTAKRKRTFQPAATATMQKRHKQTETSMQSETEQLAADMLDWETCSEGDLFTMDAGGMETDEWIYEEINDSDFESEFNAL
ncbi:unnamed protein product [Peronospora belbahrii]|uniref:Uncharacterized protein n=1 Tax=Peronospora belbahrii TaxID=622444 RepID=A0AAU9KU60_9STRA|nr:unnamed protein product [Peronospora belbahrii]CAH0517266.1 unnamed protein product [Peronospora belbahrii]